MIRSSVAKKRKLRSFELEPLITSKAGKTQIIKTVNQGEVEEEEAQQHFDGMEEDQAGGEGEGCMFHSEQGLMSFEHPMDKMNAFPRIDSESSICGASLKVGVYSKVNSMPRVGSEANWCPRQ